MKWFVALSFLVLTACATSEQGKPSDVSPISAEGTLAELDAVATGSECDAEATASAENFAPAAGVAGSTAIAKDNLSIVGWASEVVDVDFGENVTDQWKHPERALGPAEGTSSDVVSLGEGGIITLGFEKPIANGAGFDLCIFENSFSDDFLEFAYVEVASQADRFVRFAAHSRVSAPVASFGTVDPTLVDGLAGKYRQGYCTPFDLSLLADRPEVASGELDLSAIRYVRIRDIIGDGRELDCASNPIYDPYPTTGGAGFDLDAAAVLEQAL
jgi:hypothetical protein